ncbi:protein preY, mitochondrial [Hyla sarda]|uniref:protein preY, mitochondrial n=1 Tax=Hyla sarda TaxID=327740 RepID=UPI0024C4058E|nr:protein preY, mitochondrial [Hyla sarda]
MMPVLGLCRGILYRAVVRSPARRPVSAVRRLHVALPCRAAGEAERTGGREFDPSVLQFLVCPLSRKPLRYDESANELVNDELGIAYPIVDGIPNMIPQDARMIHKEQKSQESENTQQ